MVNVRGIEANPEKVDTLRKIKALKNEKQVMSLTGRVAALSRFI